MSGFGNWCVRAIQETSSNLKNYIICFLLRLLQVVFSSLLLVDILSKLEWNDLWVNNDPKKEKKTSFSNYDALIPNLFGYHIQISKWIVEHLKHFWQSSHYNMWIAFCCFPSGFNSNEFLNKRIIFKKCISFRLPSSKSPRRIRKKKKNKIASKNIKATFKWLHKNALHILKLLKFVYIYKYRVFHGKYGCGLLSLWRSLVRKTW